MSEWKSATMGAFLPSSFDTLVSTTETVTGTVTTVLTAIRAVIATIKSVLIAFPIFDFASALIAAVEAFKNDFLASGIYGCLLWDYPLKQYYRNGSGGESFEQSFLYDLHSSFTDTQDPNRPTFHGSCAMLVLVVGAPGIPGVRPVVEMLKTAFSWWTELSSVYTSISRIEGDIRLKEVFNAIRNGDVKVDPHPSRQTLYLQRFEKAWQNVKDYISDSDYEAYIKPLIPTDFSVSSINSFITSVEDRVKLSSYPDWQALSLRKIVPPIVDVIDQAFQPLIDALKAGRDIVKTIEEFIVILDQKIASLQRVIDQINLYVEQLNALLSATGVYALWITSDAGVTGLAVEFKAATNPPFEGLDNGFYSGVALVAGGPSLTSFTNFFKPIGS